MKEEVTDLHDLCCEDDAFDDWLYSMTDCHLM